MKILILSLTLISMTACAGTKKKENPYPDLCKSPIVKRSADPVKECEKLKKRLEGKKK